MEVDTSLEKVEAFISRPSFSLYMFILNFMSELLQISMSKMILGVRDCYLQCLYIGSEPRYSHQAHIVCFEDSLEVAVNCH
jgi:hypothetical protein